MCIVVLRTLANHNWKEIYRGPLAETSKSDRLAHIDLADIMAIQELNVGKIHTIRYPSGLYQAVQITQAGLPTTDLSKLHEFTFHYKPDHVRPYGFCQVRLMASPQGKIVVICTEVPSNPGQTVINAAEIVVSNLVWQYGLDPNNVIWVEHLPDRNEPGRPLDSTLTESYDQMTFQWTQMGDPWPAAASSVNWTCRGREWVEELLGQPLGKIEYKGGSDVQSNAK